MVFKTKNLAVTTIAGLLAFGSLSQAAGPPAPINGPVALGPPVFSSPSAPKAIARCMSYETGGKWFDLRPDEDDSRTIHVIYDGTDTSQNFDLIETERSTTAHREYFSKSTYTFDGQELPNQIISYITPANTTADDTRPDNWTMLHATLMQGSLSIDLVCVTDPIL